ncbi:MAG: biopolymer transporter ExbD [Phycisphaerae bacterium]|nr:biopolymer transporter ExbD [Phycisphaerae bacterium]
MSRLAEPVRVVPNLIPMIDIVSQLVIFFMLATHFISGDVDVDVQLPDLDHSVAKEAAKEGEPHKVLLNIKPSPADEKVLGDVNIGAVSMTALGEKSGKAWNQALLEILVARKAAADDAKGNLICVMRVDKRIAWAGVQQVMMIISQAKITDVRLAAPLPVSD